MLKLYKSIKAVFIVLFMTTALVSCSDMLDADQNNAINPDDNYKTTSDADNAILGIYSKFMGLVDRVVVLEEDRKSVV